MTTLRLQLAIGWIVVSLSLSGCTTTAYLPEHAVDGANIGADAPWADWTPRAPAVMSPDDKLKPATVFDAWRVDDPRFFDSAWDAAFHLLAAINNGVDAPSVSEGLEALMMQLEPGRESVRVEIAFLSHGHGDAEGIVVRMVAPGGAGLWLEAIRAAGEEEEPIRWMVRAEPAVEESAGLTARFDREDSSQKWDAYIAEGADTVDPGEPLDVGVEWAGLLDRLRDAVWEPVTGISYAEPDVVWRDFDDIPLAEGWPATLGADVQARQLEDFAPDTRFPPRTRGGDFEQFTGENS